MVSWIEFWARENDPRKYTKTKRRVWDETIVLAPSEIGELAVFARRSGDIWFLGVINGLTGRTIRVPVGFLGRGKYQATLVRDQQDDPAAVKIEELSVSSKDSLSIRMRAGGGFVGRFAR